VLPSLAQEDLSNVDFGTYTQDQFSTTCSR